MIVVKAPGGSVTFKFPKIAKWTVCKWMVDEDEYRLWVERSLEYGVYVATVFKNGEKVAVDHNSRSKGQAMRRAVELKDEHARGSK